jgi:DNA-directed RNA polymerase subunit RPC12/RpoP
MKRPVDECEGCGKKITPDTAQSYGWGVCDECGEDYCTKCGEVFGFSGEDENGWNSTCVHCGHDTYETRARDD